MHLRLNGTTPGFHLTHSTASACNCVGPQNGQPKCPCMMANVVERDGRWIQKEVDLGPVRPSFETLGFAHPLKK